MTHITSFRNVIRIEHTAGALFSFGQFYRLVKRRILYGLIKDGTYCINSIVFTHFQNAKLYSFHNLSFEFILELFLIFRKFQPRYSQKIYSCKKKRVQTTIFVVYNFCLNLPNLCMQLFFCKLYKSFFFFTISGMFFQQAARQHRSQSLLPGKRSSLFRWQMKRNLAQFDYKLK